MKYHIEHPTRGVLIGMDTTDSGKVGRFSPTKSRDKALVFPTADLAANARQRLTSVDPADCMVMRAPVFQGDLYERVLVGPIEEPRHG